MIHTVNYEDDYDDKDNGICFLLLLLCNLALYLIVVMII